jgi:hypothetical protein
MRRPKPKHIAFWGFVGFLIFFNRAIWRGVSGWRAKQQLMRSAG